MCPSKALNELNQHVVAPVKAAVAQNSALVFARSAGANKKKHCVAVWMKKSPPE